VARVPRGRRDRAADGVTGDAGDRGARYVIGYAARYVILGPPYVSRRMGAPPGSPDVRPALTVSAPHHHREEQQMQMTRSTALAVAVLALAACNDDRAPSVTAPSPAPPLSAFIPESEGSNALKRYVSIGTSVSMGWQSDGVNAESQSQSWPAQLSRLAGREMDIPYLDGTGCKAPIAAPLAANTRTSGEPLNVSDAAALCTSLRSGLDLPARNVALAGATTYDALYSTPQNIGNLLFSRLAQSILPSGTPQLYAAVDQNPKVISIELGANEVLQARSGVAIPGVTIFPTANWIPLYNTVADTAAKYAQRVLLTGLITDVGTFPSFRRGSEIFADPRRCWLHSTFPLRRTATAART